MLTEIAPSWTRKLHREFILTIIVFVCSALPVLAQPPTETQVKGAMIYNFIQYVGWEDEDNFSDLVIGIFGDNNPLYEELSNAISGSTIRNKTIRVERVSDLAQAGDAHVLVIPESENDRLNNIARTVRSSNTLLVTDRSTQNRSIMINFLQPEDDLITFEVNRSNIVYERLTMSTDILLLGGTELDIAELYREMDSSLLELQSSFAEQQAVIDQQAEQVRAQEQQIQSNELELQQFEQRVQELNAEIVDYDDQIATRETSLQTLQGQQEEMNGTLQLRQQELDLARNNLQRDQAVLEENEAQISALQDDISSNILILETQREEISQQEEDILRQGQAVQQLEGTVETQSGVLFLFGLLLILLVIVAIVVYWGNRKLKEMGKRLELNNAELQISKQEAESASESKASFLAAMSHEIRTPMNGVVGMVDLLSQTKMDSEQSQMLQTVRDSGHSLLTIINDILDFSKIEAGKLDLEAVDSNLTELVETVAQTLAPTALKKDVQLITYIDPKVPGQLTLDPVRIRQILTNLGSNAIKFSESGEVSIRAELAPGKDESKVTIRFSVIDQGIGISAAAQKHLFKEFSQADSSTTRKYGGTGLGLAICKRLTDIMGGVIGAESIVGEGSTFYCEIPFSAPTEIKDDKKTNDLTNLRILVVTQSENYREACAEYLQRWNADVASIDNLNQCLAHLQAAKDSNSEIDIIVIPHHTDHEMLAATRGEFIDAGFSPYPRFVIGKDPRRSSKALEDMEDVTLVEINPLRRARFVSAVAIAAGRESPEIIYEEKVFDIKGGRAPTVEEALEQNKLILFAEDNLTNQDVIRRQLTRLGYACEIASDGKEAFEMWCDKNYAVLLTDCHMPEMDGFELTSAIRKAEESTSRRAPIIAITANALQGEAERCIAAGMDDYMSKPVEMKTLQSVLHKWMGDGGRAEPEPAQDKQQANPNSSKDETMPAQANDSIDERVLKDVFGDDEETFKEILVDFVVPSKEIVTEIQSGYQQHSADALMLAAHKLKSAALTVGAMELGGVCKELEAAANNEDWEIINRDMPKLDGLMNEVEKYVAHL